MGERDQLKNGLVARFTFLTSELGFRGPGITDRSLLLTLLYRSDDFNLEISSELRDWFLDFRLRPPGSGRIDPGSRKWIRSYDLIKPYFSAADEALFHRVAQATAARDKRGSVPAMLEAADPLAALLRSVLPRLLAHANQLFRSGPPASD